MALIPTSGLQAGAPTMGSAPPATSGGKSLPQASSNAYYDALRGAGTLGGMGGAAFGQGMNFAQDAGAGANFALGFAPKRVTAGSLPGVDLSQYMNPFTKGVIDPTMAEMNRQELLQSRNLAGQATSEGSFGGDRFAIQQAENNRNFDTQRAGILGQLNQANFNNAQSMATGDLNRDLAAKQGNQQIGSGMFTSGLGNLTSLAGTGQQVGGSLATTGQDQAGRLAEQGFNTGQKINNSNLAMGTLQQQIQQRLIDAANGQVTGATNAPTSGLEQFLGSVLSPGNSGTTTTTSNPGKGGAIGSVGSGISSIAPMFLK